MIIIASYSNVSVTYTADGTQTVFSFPFDYLRKAFVYVEINDETTLEQGTDFTVYEKTVVFQTAPVADTVVKIYRQTDTRPLVSWADASVLRAKDMTIQQVQVLHILEEDQEWIRENSMIKNEDGEWDARGAIINNVGTAENPDDAVTKGYVDNTYEYVRGKIDELDTAVEEAKDAKEAAQLAQEDAEEAKDTVEEIASQIDIMARALFYDNVAGMVADETLQAGQTAATKGYLSINDGGNAIYTIREKTEQDIDDGKNIVFLNNGLVAEKIDPQLFSLNITGANILPVGADLNNYLKPGVYYSTNGTHTETLRNKPYFSPYVGIRLVVSYMQRDDVVIQELYTNTLRRFVRSYTHTADVKWEDWKDESYLTKQKEVEGQITKTAYGLEFWGQDAAYYEGKLFMFPGSNQQKMRVYDWEGKTLIGEYPLGGNINSHGNTLTWGNKYDESDPYPLLYSSGYNGVDADGVTDLPWGTCQVYRIAEDYSTTMIQDIRIAFANTSNPLWYTHSGGTGVVPFGDFVADPKHNRLYVLTSRVNADNISHTRLFIFALPDVSSTSVTLQESDIIEYYDLPFYPWLQGAEYYDNKIYLTSGYNAGQANTTFLEVIDLNNKKQCATVDLNDIQTEGEGIVVINGKVFVAQASWYCIEGISEASNIGNLSKLRHKRRTMVDALSNYLAADGLGAIQTGPIVVSTGSRNLAKMEDTNSFMTIDGGTSTETGAHLILYGKDEQTQNIPGGFVLAANNGTNGPRLEGRPNGTLKWGNKIVEYVISNSFGTSGYIRYASGVQICWGQNAGVGSAGTTITFPAPFSETPSVSAATANPSYVASAEPTATQVTLKTSYAAGIYNRWIAVGHWR